MAPSKDPSPERQSSDVAADVAQTYRDLARGEQAATALEANLNNLESKLDALLAAMDGMEENSPATKTVGSAAKGKAPAASETSKEREDKDKSGPAASS